MIGFVITGHGSFPEGVLQSVKMITGEMAQVETVPFHEDPDKLEDQLEKAIANVETGSGVVCFADLAGGTPFNVSARLASTIEQVRVIGGVNSPMLLSGLYQREQNIDDFVELIIKEGQDNIKPFKHEQKNKTTDVESDGI